MRHATALLFALLLVAPCFADSIDDAEAKRRGVPVAQVQAENELAKANARIAGLQKQLDALKAQLAATQSQADATNATAPATAAASARNITRPPVRTESIRNLDNSRGVTVIPVPPKK